MATFGGTVRFTYSGTPLRMRGHITIFPSNVRSTGIPNQDGSTSRTLAPMGFRAKMKFEDSSAGLPNPPAWDAIVKAGPYNVTVVEDQTNVTHMWTNALFTGEPSTDRETGETDGLELIADTYQTMNAG